MRFARRLTAIACGLGLAFAALRAEEAKTLSDDDYELYQMFVDTLDQVERNYVKPVSRRELIEAAIGGVVGKLDPYSNYITPEEIGRFKTTVESQFGGIGIQVTMERGQLKVLSPLVGTPAYRAGLRPGDAIVEIEGKNTDGITIDEAVRQLKGSPGSTVSIAVIHPGASAKQVVSIHREVIHVETVLGDRRADDDTWDLIYDKDRHIGYVRLTAFSRDTADDLRKALAEMQGKGLKGLVLDLRFNPGGLLSAAIEVSDLFIAEGRIVSTEGRNSPERVWDAQKEGTFEGFPMAVLVNRYSASASEIVAACLQDHKRAMIVGERTWGKGSVQNVIELEGGKSALKLTTASYKRPNGHNIHRFPDAPESAEWGVSPDEGYDLKLDDRGMTDLVLWRRHRDLTLAQVKNRAAAALAESPATIPPVDTAEKPKDEPPGGAALDGPALDEATAGGQTPPSDENREAFVDRQLQKALDYLAGELAESQ